MTELGAWRLAAGDIAAAMDARRSFERLLRTLTKDPSDLCAAELIFGELVANGLEHGSGTVTLRLQRSDTDAVLSVHDEGGWTIPPTRALAPKPAQERGRGVFFVQTAARRIDTLRDGTTRIVLPVTLK